jgi:hypothetical protein
MEQLAKALGAAGGTLMAIGSAMLATLIDAYEADTVMDPPTRLSDPVPHGAAGA